MNTREKLAHIKVHIREHKEAYIAGGVGLLVGAAGTMVLITKNPDVQAVQKIIGLVNWKPKQTIEVWIEALGDPGNIVQDITTGTIYASQGQAARELGLHPSMVSRHLKGEFPDVKGHKFTILGKALVSSASQE